jgi:hypothetical protein
MEMSELRDEIERQFKAHGLIPDEAENETNSIAAETPPEEIPTETVAAVAVTVPEGYTEKFASEFKNLPQEWQVFLCEREAENKKKINDYRDAYGFLEFLFGAESERFNRRGFHTVQEWLQGLAWLDAAMEENPAATLVAIANVYGVPLGELPRAASEVSPEMLARIGQLERGYHHLTSYLQHEQQRNLIQALQMFGRQTDSEGNLLHPYFNEVCGQIVGLLNCGMAQNIDDAYQSAVWLQPTVRNELIQKQISSRAQEAEKAKKAAFALKGKAEVPTRELTLRETLEKNMAALMG